MPLVAAAMCPHPPLLVPEVAAGAAAELDDLRAACDAAVAHLCEINPDGVVIVGGGPSTGWYSPSSVGALAPWGVPLEIPVGAAAPRGTDVFSLGIMIGAWLLGRHSLSATIAAFAIAPTAHAHECAAIGSELATNWRPDVALLVMGDGSACRGEKSPGYDDPRAEPFDASVAAALATADTDALLALDQTLATELHVAGRAPWQTLAGAVAADGRAWRADLLYDKAPYGVAYFVASWSAA